MTRLLAYASARRVRAYRGAALLALLIGLSHTPVASGEGLVEGRSACGNAMQTSVRFEPILHKISTSALIGDGAADLQWVLSSEVTADGDSAKEGTRYCYAYVFKNVGTTPLKISLVSHRLALSPLFEAMQDFSLVLAPGATEMIRFTTGSAPELAIATAYNSARDEKIAKWDLVSSGPISLYLPAAMRAAGTPSD